MKRFGDLLEELRGVKTQKEFAAQLEIPLNTYTNWVRGIREPSASALINISTRLGVSVDWLLGLSEVRTTSKTVDEAARGVRSRSKVLDPNQVLRDEIDALKRRMNALESANSMGRCG